MTALSARAARGMGVTRVDEPYLHYCVEEFFDPPTVAALRRWAEESEGWQLRESSFYSQHSQAIYVGARLVAPDLVLPVDLFDHAIGRADRIFGVEFRRDRFEAHAHRLEPGQGIGLHNDWPIGGTETHRIVAHLNPDHHDRHGGHLVMYSAEDPRAIAAAYRPIDNMAVAFQLGQRSWHSVAEVREGRRHSIVFSFWEAPPDTESASTAAWAEKRELLIQAGARTVPHTGRTLYDHLTGVAGILDAWGCDEATVEAGLFHSVYGTPSFDASPLRGLTREDLRSFIGERAERLVHDFSGSRFAEAVGGDNSEDATALIHMHWANICEQARHELIGDQDLRVLSGAFAATHGRLRPAAAAEIAALLGLAGASK